MIWTAVKRPDPFQPEEHITGTDIRGFMFLSVQVFIRANDEKISVHELLIPATALMISFLL
jgi:hypothetical protein